MRRTRPDPEWFAVLRKGDVLQSPGGDYRVVRAVSRRARDGKLMFVVFVIRHCSWTKRPFTTYSAADLKTNGWGYVGVRVKLASDADRQLEKDLLAMCRGVRGVYKCCTVQGIP